MALVSGGLTLWGAVEKTGPPPWGSHSLIVDSNSPPSERYQGPAQEREARTAEGSPPRAVAPGRSPGGGWPGGL